MGQVKEVIKLVMLWGSKGVDCVGSDTFCYSKRHERRGKSAKKNDAPSNPITPVTPVADPNVEVSDSPPVQLKYNSNINSIIKVEQAASTEEAYLSSFLTGSETTFNNVFADVYSKMLEIGVISTDMGPWYEDKPDPHLEKPREVCPQGWYYAKIANIP